MFKKSYDLQTVEVDIPSVAIFEIRVEKDRTFGQAEWSGSLIDL